MNRIQPPSASRRITLRRHDEGYSAEGPGFYVWDENPAEVERVAQELSRGNARVAPTQRLLVLRDPSA